jgi:Tol biopolymer transport system component
MTIRRIGGLLATAAVIGCGTGSDAPPSTTTTKRTTLLPGPGAFGFEFSKDGRLAYSKLIDGKAAVFVADADGRNARRVSFGVWDIAPTWSPDGKWIAFERDAGGHNDAIIVPADSGAERAVGTTPTRESPSAWLPDGSGLLFRRGGLRGQEIWLYQMADGSSAKQLDLDGSVDAYPSPDGKSLLYSLSKNGKSTIWLWDREKKTSRQLTTEGLENIGYYSFSPDGRSIIYGSRRTGTSDLWRLDVASGEQRQVTQDIADDYNGRWSPDGSRILFTSTRGGQPDLWVLTTGESDVQRLTEDAVSEDDAQWASDGRSIYTRVGLGRTHLYAVPVAGGQPVALTSGDWAVCTAQVSHDGTQVAYCGSKNGDEDIWVVPVAGGASRLVSGAPGFDAQPDWAPDGKHLAFSSVRGGNPDVWITPVDSGPAVRLTDWPSEEGTPRWSPDGKTIAFLSSREAPGADLWIMPAQGGTPKRLTRVGTVDTYRWSPDGRSIAYGAQSDAAGGQAVFIVPAGGGEPKRFSPPPSLNPEWRPDGRELKVMQCDKGYCSTDIWSVEGKRLRTLTTRKDPYEFALEWSSDGSQVLVSWQDIFASGENKVDLRPSAGGSSRTLDAPAGFTMAAIGFANGDKTAILLGGPYGTSLQRIDVSGLVTTAKR